MNNFIVTICLTRNYFKDNGTFPSQKFMPCHVTRNALDDFKTQRCTVHKFIEFCIQTRSLKLKTWLKFVQFDKFDVL